MNFKKPREVFAQDKLIYKKPLPNFTHMSWFGRNELIIAALFLQQFGLFLGNTIPNFNVTGCYFWGIS
jgi:hypothetical protein